MEVRAALKKEDQHGRTVLFPIHVDDAAMDTAEKWAHDIPGLTHEIRGLNLAC